MDSEREREREPDNRFETMEFEILDEWRHGLVQVTEFRPHTSKIDIAGRELSWIDWLEEERNRIERGPGRKAKVYRQNGESALFVNEDRREWFEGERGYFPSRAQIRGAPMLPNRMKRMVTGDWQKEREKRMSAERKRLDG